MPSESHRDRGRIVITRRLACLAVALAALLLMLPAAPAAARAERLQGDYIGLAEAEGMRITLRAAGEGYSGTFVDSNGVTAPIDARIVGNAAEAILQFPARTVKLRMFREAIGLRVVAIPFDAAGQPQVELANALVFVPPGTRIPEIPVGYQEPAFKVRVVDPDTFLISYEFWPPEGVAFGWESLEARYRPLISLFPTVLADILWKLCSSSYQPAALGEALRGQGVTCEEVVSRLDRIQSRGKFEAWKAAVHREKAIVLDAARCARGYTMLKSVCEPAARRVSEAATALVTVDAVLKKF